MKAMAAIRRERQLGIQSDHTTCVLMFQDFPGNRIYNYKDFS
jgi:hypothetical protein